MARHPKNHAAAEELGKQLQALHAEHGGPTPKQIELWIYDAFGVHVSDESIRKAHNGDVDPTGCQVELIAGIAAFYDVDPTALGPHAARRTMRVVTMTSDEARVELPPRTGTFSDAENPVQGVLFAA